MTSLAFGEFFAVALALVLGIASCAFIHLRNWLRRRTNWSTLAGSDGWAVITGATDGIGKEFALQFAAKGYNIILVGRSHSKLAEVSQEIDARFNRRSLMVELDFAHPKEESFERLSQLASTHKVIVLVNNVGVSHTCPIYFIDESPEVISDILNVNIANTLKVTRIVMTEMLKRRKGYILNVGSFAGIFPTPLLSVYSGSKAFLAAWSQAIAAEGRQDNVHVEYLNTFYVCSKMSKISKPSRDVPTASGYVDSVIRNAGRGYFSTPYFWHEINLHFPICRESEGVPWPKSKSTTSEPGQKRREPLQMSYQDRDRTPLSRVSSRRQYSSRRIRSNSPPSSRSQPIQQPIEDDQWEQKEGEFHVSQSKQRATLRISERRAKAIDFLCLNTVDKWEARYVFVDEPRCLLAELDEPELEELLAEIRMVFVVAEKEELSRKYWESLERVTERVLMDLRREFGKECKIVDAHKSVREDIAEMLDGKTAEQLSSLEANIIAKLKNPSNVDLDYWEALLIDLRVKRDEKVLMNCNSRLIDRMRKDRSNSELPLIEADIVHYWSGAPAISRSSSTRESPIALPLDPGPDSPTNLDNSPAALAMYSEEARRHVPPEDIPFNTEAQNIPRKPAPWEKIYSPRKPRYFNRVHMKHEWNKYNTLHFTAENPPPAIAQGFRFNIFYPDLVNPSRPPTYHLERDPLGRKEIILVRFVAGPPYEDLVFEIPNEEWDFSHFQGFKSTFENGALRLMFWFKKRRYRR